MNMTAKIYQFSGITTLDIPADRVLEGAIGKLQGAVVIGFDHDGEFYGASSIADGGSVMWLMEICKKIILEGKG
jgi:hypothetical protein